MKKVYLPPIALLLLGFYLLLNSPLKFSPNTSGPETPSAAPTLENERLLQDIPPQIVQTESADVNLTEKKTQKITYPYDHMEKLTAFEKEKFIAEAKETLKQYSSCVGDGSDCGQRTDEWEDYFGVGGPILHQNLLNSLKMLSVADVPVERELLFQLMKAPSKSLSFEAARVALDQSSSVDQGKEVLSQSENLRFTARALFLEKYAATLERDQDFVDQVSKALGKTSDLYTRAETMSRLGRLRLQKQDIYQVAQSLCEAYADPSLNLRKDRVLDQLVESAKDSGHPVDRRQLCVSPEDLEES